MPYSILTLKLLSQHYFKGVRIALKWNIDVNNLFERNKIKNNNKK